MKIKTLYFAMLALGLTAQYANAADGTLTFKGNITSSTCQLTSTNGNTITVPLGTIPSSHFAKLFDKGPQVGFIISMTHCDAGTYYLILDGKTVVNEPNILSLDNPGVSGNASGVGIQVTGQNDEPITISTGLDSSVAKVDISGKDEIGQFYLKANYVAVGGNVSPGVANATAQFTIIQK